jgi:hypothetical protein
VALDGKYDGHWEYLHRQSTTGFEGLGKSRDVL